MNRIAAAVLLTITVNFMTPMMSSAYASPIEDKLVQSLMQNKAFTQFQGISGIQGELSKGQKQAFIEAIVKSALQRSGNSGVEVAASNNKIDQTIEGTIRQEVERNLTGKLSSYASELDALASLFQKNSNLNPDSVRNNNSLTGAPENYSRVVNMTATAYAPGVLDNGKWNDQNYVGGKVQKGVAAVDPSVIPMGTRLWVEGYGEALAVDQGSAIKGNRIDLAFNSRQEALDYGIQNVKVYVLN